MLLRLPWDVPAAWEGASKLLRLPLRARGGPEGVYVDGAGASKLERLPCRAVRADASGPGECGTVPPLW